MSIYGYGYGTNDGQNALDWDYYRYPEQPAPQTGGRPLDYPAHLPWPPQPNVNVDSGGGGGAMPNINGGASPTGQGIGSLNGGKEYGWKDVGNFLSNQTLGPMGEHVGLGNYNAGNAIGTVGAGLLGVMNPVVGMGLSWLGNQAWGNKYGEDGFWGNFWGEDKDKDKDDEKTDDGLGDNPLGIPGKDNLGRGFTNPSDLSKGPNQFGLEGYNMQGGEGVTDPNGPYGDGSGLGYNAPTTIETFSPDNNYGYTGPDSNGNSQNFNYTGGDGSAGDGSGFGENNSGFGGFEDGTDESDAAAADQGEW